MLLRAQSLAKNKGGRLQIEDLSAGTKHVEVKARVLELSKPREVLTRFGSQAYVSNALIADSTESIDLSLWNEQVDGVSIGDVIEIENGHVAYFRGKRQLRIGRSGEINIVKDEAFPSMQQLGKT
jgi:ssDNA-binding replication factor A large subunit